jgi:parvulin-like peptidyl-prolyl isomerase
MARSFLWHCALVLAFAASSASAQTGPDDPVLVENQTVKVYRSDYEAELMKLPAEIRSGFANSQKRIGDLLTRLLVQKTFAAQAEKDALDKTPENAVRLRLERQRVLAQLRVEDIERRAARSFEAQRAQFEARAHEIYLADRKKYEVPEQVSVSHILFDLKKHTSDEAHKLAQETRARILAGADFNEVAKELSDDQSARKNSGHIGFFSRGDMDSAFASAAFALKRNGEISEPVLSSFGWHLIKREDHHDGRVRSFDEVRGLIMAELRKKHVEEQREAALAAARDDPSTKVHHEVVDSLYVRPPSAEELKAMSSGHAAPGTPQAATPAK